MIIRRSASAFPPASIEHDVIGGSPLSLAYGYTRAGIDWYATEDELEALKATGEVLRRQDQADKAKGVLAATDYVESKARRTKRTISPAWDEWREAVATIANGSGEDIPPEPDRWASELEQPPTPVAPDDPENFFADLMLADETIDDAKARLSQRLRELRHYLIAPEIKVNEDGSVGLTPAEQSELQDLERRQTLGRWLEA